MRKRIISILLAMCMVLGMMPTIALADNAPTSGTCGDNLTWTLNAGTLTISGTGFMNAYSATTASVPWPTNAVTKVVIDDGVTSVGDYAFRNCTQLTSVVLPDSIAWINSYAFANCENLTSIQLPDKVVEIGRYAFNTCTGLTDISLPAKTTIKDNAFEGCTNIKNIKLTGTGPMSDHIESWTDPKPDQNTPWYVASVAGNDIEVEIVDGVTSVGADAFLDCNGLTSVIIPDSVTAIKMRAFLGCSGLRSVTIPSSVSALSESMAFKNCTGLISVVIADGASTLGSETFAGCTSLNSITIPSSITSIVDAAFDGCDNLKDVYYSGAETDWAAISIGSDNNALINATIHYNSAEPDDPNNGNLTWGDPDAQQTLEVGKTLTLTVQMGDGSSLDANRLNWTLNPALGTAEIVGQGAVDEKTAYVTLKGVYPGKVTLTGTLAPAPGESILNRPTVSQEITVIGAGNISFGQDTYTVTADETTTVSVTVQNPNGLTADGVRVVSSDNTVAEVTSVKGPDIQPDGMSTLTLTVGVRGLKAGTATLTASAADGRSASCGVIVSEKPDVGFQPVIGQAYPIKVGNSGRSYALVPDEMKGRELSWEWKSSDGSIVSFSQNGILGEMSGEGKLIVTDEISERFYARAVGTVTLTCTVDGTIIFKQDVIVSGSDDNRPVIDSNDYNVQLRGDAEDVFEREFESVETAYKKVLDRLDDKLDKPESIYPAVDPSIEEQAMALLTHDKDKKQKEKFLLFSPSTPDELKLCCYRVFCEQLFNSSKEAGFSLKDISLGDPYQTALIAKMAKFAGEKLDDDFPMVDNNGRKVTVEANFVSYPIGDATGLGTMKCYYDSNPYKSYTCYLLPSYSSAEQSMKAYLQELIDLEYRAIKNIRTALVKDLIPFDLKTLGEKGAAKALEILHKEAGALEEYKLLGLDGTISSCYDYGKAVWKLKSKIADSPTDIKGITEGIEQLAQLEVPQAGNVLKREISALKSAQKNFQQKIWSKLIAKELPEWADHLIRVMFKCPVNVSVLKNGQLIGYAGDDDFWYNDGIVIEEYGDAKIVYYNPADGISFEITGTADGSMSYTVEEFNNGSPTGRINSDIISVSKGQVFTAHFPNKDLEKNLTEFTLNSSGEIIRPMEYISAGDSAPVDISVSVVPTNSGHAYGSGTYVRGDAAVLYESPADGYDFSGWYDVSGNLVSQSPVYEFSAMENRTLEARFTVSSISDDEPDSDFQIYLISFDPNGGTMESYLKITDENNCIDELPIPVREDYTFDGWYTLADGGEKVDVNRVYTVDTTLYAHWKQGTEQPDPTAVTVTFDANGGSVAPTTKTAGKDGKLSSLPTPTRSGYNFTGWYTAPTGGNQVTVNTVFTVNTTVYAHWTYINTDHGPSSPGGSSGSHAGSSTYVITVAKPEHGKVTSSPANASSGSTVTLTVTPDTGYALGALTVTDSRGSEIKLTSEGEGKYTFAMPGRAVTVKAVFVPLPDDTNQACDGGANCPSNGYADLGTVGTWYHEAVDYALRNGLMNGYTGTAFGPDDNLSRAQFAQILYNKEGKPAVSGGNAFTDVNAGQWYAPAVTWAATSGIVSGYGNGKFGPDDSITREQLAVMLWRYAGIPAATGKELHFTDTDKASSYALDALRWATENGVLNGYGDGRLNPGGLATRAQVAQMLMNFLENK